MTNEPDSTQPFDINDDTGEPSNRPEHDEAQDDVAERLADGDTITPDDTAD